MWLQKLVICFLIISIVEIIVLCDTPPEIKLQRAQLIKKHLKRLKKVDGAIKLVGGAGEFEGNVEILHDGTWGAICDDEWDVTEAKIICKQLGYSGENAVPTANSYFGPAKRKFWMDNVYCDNTDTEITNCRFDGWGQHDCTPTEAAGVICEKPEDILKKQAPRHMSNMIRLPKNLEVRLTNGRVKTEGRVEIKIQDEWEVVCGDGWSLLESLVVCKTLDMGFASDAMQTNYFGGNLTKKSLANIKCIGNEKSLKECMYDEHSIGQCESTDVAAVSCTQTLADLSIDHYELMRSAHLEDRQMFYLQCAMEENCVATTAYEIQKENPAWHLDSRRLLKFTAKIFNAGNADFRPAIPKHLWEWHMCHMHYHSMEVFATFDIYDGKGQRVAEGHKASFCLEDNQCLPGVAPKYACANYGDQGISVNCSDIYKYTVDCQWVDITDLKPGVYTMKVAVNPEFKVAEMTFENNAAVCDFHYTEYYGTVTNCSVQRP
ncbi:lysyl oxidase homolog 3-like [Diorhabda sublineata]|uniref:lysyl oxidase homolog 3-like n=1 Tax=Diorhabda sublineata TaxID=1163346 RepID=UPI0024E066B5|nr:lysyl oxidase homolog 3-like [Diorhabda sublineata]